MDNDLSNTIRGIAGNDTLSGDNGSDTYVLTGDASTETFRIYARAAWLAVAGNTAAQLNANTEIKIHSLLTTAHSNDGVVNGTVPGAPGDVVQVIGNFAAPFTSLAFNTIRIAGSSANDTVDISGLTSARSLELGVESDFQLMQLVNQTTMAGDDVFDHMQLQSGQEIIGLGAAAQVDLFMSSRDMLSGLDTTGPGSHQIATDYLLLQA